MAYREGAARVTALLPFDPPMLGDLDRLGPAYNLCQSRETVAGNMVQIMSLRSLLASVADELSRRLDRVGWRGQIAIASDAQAVTLFVTPGQVHIAEGAEAEPAVALAQTELMRSVLGIMPPAWAGHVSPDHPAYVPLAAMFPPVPGAFNT